MKSFVVGGLGCNCTILADEKTRDAVIVDPGGDVDTILPYVREQQLNVRLAIHTHAHLDHICGTREMKDATASRIMLHKGDSWLYDNLEMQAKMFGWSVQAPLPVDDWLEHGQELKFGGHAIEVIHTPGHTPGSVCFLVPESNLMFSGDTLFASSIGRTDLWGGSFEQIMESITTRLMPLDDKIRVVPGHGEATTIGQEKRSNPFILKHI